MCRGVIQSHDRAPSGRQGCSTSQETVTALATETRHQGMNKMFPQTIDVYVTHSSLALRSSRQNGPDHHEQEEYTIIDDVGDHRCPQPPCEENKGRTRQTD